MTTILKSCPFEEPVGKYEIESDKPHEMTNEEWLRTLPADERVKEILSRGFMTEKRTAEEFVEWLKEKHDG